MKTLLVLLFLFPSLCFSIKGTITVLEAPLFEKPDENSHVVVYRRKGHQIYIHDSDITPINLLDSSAGYVPEEGTKFYKSRTPGGKEVYILKRHVFVNYNDVRELSQKVTKFDDTDYRIQEPLSDTYPFVYDSGYRGQFYLGLGPSNFSSYRFKESIANSSYSLSKDFSAVWSKNMDKKLTSKFFLGFLTSITSQTARFTMPNQFAEQTHTRLSIGPYIAYDNYQSKKMNVSTYATLQVLLIDQMEIRIKDIDKNSDTRTYSSRISALPIIGANLQFPKAVFEFDLVMGSNIKFHLPKTYITQEAADNENLWQFTIPKDSFEQPFLVETDLYLGFQSYY